MLWVQLYPHTEYITELTSGPVTCSAKHNKHAYSFHCFTPQPPINKHSGPEDTMYVNHSGASVKWWHFSPHFLNQTPWMKSGSSGFPDNTNCPEKEKKLRPPSISREKAKTLLYFFRQLRSLVRGGNRFPLFTFSATQSTGWEMVKFPVRNDDSRQVVLGNLLTTDWDPLVLPKWSNHISASSVWQDTAATTENDGSSLQLVCVDLKSCARMRLQNQSL